MVCCGWEGVWLYGLPLLNRYDGFQFEYSDNLTVNHLTLRFVSVFTVRALWLTAGDQAQYVKARVLVRVSRVDSRSRGGLVYPDYSALGILSSGFYGWRHRALMSSSLRHVTRLLTSKWLLVRVWDGSWNCFIMKSRLTKNDRIIRNKLWGERRVETARSSQGWVNVIVQRWS